MLDLVPSRPFVVGSSTHMQKVYQLLKRIAPSEINVLITGESGTGKELIARAVHSYSRRSKGRFVAVNCAALPENLIESELFGHERGAFTGASALRIGKFEYAHGGTIFLDEIAEMSKSAQGKTLRVLQEREIERLGGNRSVKLDVRVVAATNKNLEQITHGGLFREDLFYRLKVAAIHLSPLRERKEDILPLAMHFLSIHAIRNGSSVSSISERAREALEAYSYPGNVRELENIIQLAVVLARGGEITVNDLPDEVRNETPAAEDAADGMVKSGELLDALRHSMVAGNEGVGGDLARNRRTAALGRIHDFLLSTDGREFSRREFANFLSEHARDGRSKYGTAGRFMRVLRRGGILEHNRKKANQARCRLADIFLLDGREGDAPESRNGATLGGGEAP